MFAPSTPMRRHLQEQVERTPLRRSTNIAFNKTPLPEKENDESERNKRRSMVDMQRRVSSANVPQTGTPMAPPVGENEIKTHFDICLKLFVENKITVKNAWNLNIIDYMKTMVQTKKFAKDSLQVASTSLDVSAKVYGIRVDDIHSDGLKLASSMARMGHNEKDRDNDNGDGGDEATEADGDNAAKSKQPKKKRVRRLSASKNHTIAKCSEMLLGDVAKTETAFFQTRSNADASEIDNYFTNRLMTDASGCKFMLLSSKEAFVGYDDDDPSINREKSYKYKLNKMTAEICSEYRNFEVDEWDPDKDDEENDSLKNSINNQNAELVFDDKGIPVAELDGSIHGDPFNEPDPFDGICSEDEEEQQPQIIITNEVANVNEIRPDDTWASTEYLYQSQLINKSSYLWAGPSHWKLKHLQRAISKFSGVVEKKFQQAEPKKRKQVEIGPIDFRKQLSLLPEENDKQMPSKKFLSHSTDRYLLPVKYLLPDNFFSKLLMRDVYVQSAKNDQNDDLKETAGTDKEYEISPYNYGNPNDSYYCSQNVIDDNGAGDGGTDEEEEIVTAQHQQYMGENLIELGDIVPKTKVSYSTKAKKMDMKKLKVSIWRLLVKDTTDEINNDMYKKPITKVNFSEIYTTLPASLNTNMREELSCPLAFIALLHLANEQGLKFTTGKDLADFTIERE